MSYVCVGGGVGQTAKNRGNRGHGVSAEIKKKKEETPAQTAQGGWGESGSGWEKRVMVVVGMFWEPHKALVVVSICRIKTLALV